MRNYRVHITECTPFVRTGSIVVRASSPAKAMKIAEGEYGDDNIEMQHDGNQKRTIRFKVKPEE